MTDLDAKQSKAMKMVVAYPFCVLLIAVLINLFVLDVKPFAVSLPDSDSLWAIALAGIAFCINHTWLMTVTETTRVRYRMYATPEEWEASGTNRKDVPDFAIRELERAHNAHRNTTENTIDYLVLLLPFLFSSAAMNAVYFWVIGFALARLGYTYSYLKGRDNMRGVFMSLGLIAMYGIASHLVISYLWVGNA